MPPTLTLSPSRLLLRAKFVLTEPATVLHDGGVLIEGAKILRVGPWKEIRDESSESLDLGEVILLPGLINAHCHLDYTDMAGRIPAPKSFSDWIKAILALKASWSYTDFALSWIRGTQMLLRSGTTCVANIEAIPELLPEARSATPLRVCSLLELTGVRSRRRPAQIVEEAAQSIEALPLGSDWAGLSPHAPYSTTPELLGIAAQRARVRRWPLAVHVAESREEFDMFVSARGAMFEWLKSQRDTTDCGHGSPVQALERTGVLGENLLAVHANYLAADDPTRLARHHVTVVHCPRSHAYFGHEAFPYGSLVEAGVNVCLGTDSLATVRSVRGKELQLDLLEELRVFARHHTQISPANLLRLVTTSPAKAIGMEGQLGAIRPGAFADLIVLPSSHLCSPQEAVLHHAGPVLRCMVGGSWVEDRYRLLKAPIRRGEFGAGRC